MGVVITVDDIKAYAEVDYIINHMNQKYIEKVPEKIRIFFSELKDPTHEVNINPYIPLQNQGLKKYTLEIIALLHLKYWCEDEERKKELYGRMRENQEKFEEQLKEKYNAENIFNNNPVKDVSEKQSAEAKQDFSNSRVVQRYNQYTEQNNDIQDFTDHVEETMVEENKIQNSLVDNEITENSKGFFQKIKEKIFSIFNKK